VVAVSSNIMQTAAGAGLPSTLIAPPLLGGAEAALVILIQGSALITVASIYAQLGRHSTQAAAALGAPMDMLDAQAALAADL
jgi:hypothetical protein